MFDFEKLEVYTHTRKMAHTVLAHLQSHRDMDPVLYDKLKEAVSNVVINLVQGTSRMVNEDKRQFYTSARGAAFESVALLQLLMDLDQVQEDDYDTFYAGLESSSKMLLGMIRSIDKQLGY